MTNCDIRGKFQDKSLRSLRDGDNVLNWDNIGEMKIMKKDWKFNNNTYFAKFN